MHCLRKGPPFSMNVHSMPVFLLQLLYLSQRTKPATTFSRDLSCLLYHNLPISQQYWWDLVCPVFWCHLTWDKWQPDKTITWWWQALCCGQDHRGAKSPWQRSLRMTPQEDTSGWHLRKTRWRLATPFLWHLYTTKSISGLGDYKVPTCCSKETLDLC